MSAMGAKNLHRGYDRSGSLVLLQSVSFDHYGCRLHQLFATCRPVAVRYVEVPIDDEIHL